MDEHDELTYLIEDPVDTPVRTRGRIPRVLFFIFSLSIAVLTANYFFHFFSLPLSESFHTLFPQNEKANLPVISYLSVGVKESVKRDVFLLMQKNREDLTSIEAELKRLEDEKKVFLETMQYKSELFDENVSLVEEGEAKESLESGIQLQRITMRFKTESERRINSYLNIYEQKKHRLLSQKEDALRSLDELGSYVRGIEAGEGLEKLSGDPGLFVYRAKGKMAQRFLLYIKRGEYANALKLYERMKIVPQESGQVDVIKMLLESLTAYKARLALYERSSLLDDIKLSYLEENYQKTLSHIQASDYLRPMLSDLQGVLYKNIETREQINQEIELKKKMKILRRKAEDFEKRGEYENALKIYEDLLILNLPSYDREYLISEIHSLISTSVRKQIKREDNTRATKYLESARNLYREGREKEAYEVYRKIATECPNSDYVEEAFSAMLEIATR